MLLWIVIITSELERVGLCFTVGLVENPDYGRLQPGTVGTTKAIYRNTAIGGHAPFHAIKFSQFWQQGI